MLKIGDSASLTKTFTDDDVRQFAAISGDANPVHLDEAYAAQTPFKKRIAHGMLTAGLISAVLGTKLPGEGSIYMSQSLSFRAPVYLDDTITARVEVINIRERKPIVTLKTVCTNQEDVVVLEGEAVLLVSGEK
jgi:acyl dehydratase